ncbi:MAG: hypothetical protein HYW49_08135 [Deltaproteobacteria bacterium]|nr:hypothetical protein [Deltaproteobacteria bacterium]
MQKKNLAQTWGWIQSTVLLLTLPAFPFLLKYISTPENDYSVILDPDGSRGPLSLPGLNRTPSKTDVNAAVKILDAQALHGGLLLGEQPRKTDPNAHRASLVMPHRTEGALGQNPQAEAPLLIESGDDGSD